MLKFLFRNHEHQARIVAASLMKARGLSGIDIFYALQEAYLQGTRS